MITLLMGSFCLWAQEERTHEEEAPRKMKFRLRSNFYTEIGYNQFLGLPADLATTVQGLGSIKLNFQAMEMLRVNKFYIGSGPGIVMREIRFEKNAILYRDTTDFLTYRFDTLTTAQGYSAKSKFQLGYLRVPLEFGILHKGFQLAAYGYVDILAWVRHKRKYATSDESIKTIQIGSKNFGTDVLQYGVGGRIGYRGLGVFANYNLSPLWRSSKGPDNVRPLQAGVYFFRSLYKSSKKRGIMQSSYEL